jgi:hypothetical protein
MHLEAVIEAIKAVIALIDAFASYWAITQLKR